MKKLLISIPVALGLAIAAPTLAYAPNQEIEAPAAQSYTAPSTSTPVSLNRDGYTVGVTYDTYNILVDDAGHQPEIDQCDGPVYTDFGAYGVSIGEHNHCGGDYVLGLEAGDRITITGYAEGQWVVVGSKDVYRGASADVLGGATWLQTCYYGSDLMRLVQIERM